MKGLKPGFHFVGSRVVKPGAFKLWVTTGFNLYSPTTGIVTQHHELRARFVLVEHVNHHQQVTLLLLLLLLLGRAVAAGYEDYVAARSPFPELKLPALPRLAVAQVELERPI
jgi:hypothetical protein